MLKTHRTSLSGTDQDLILKDNSRILVVINDVNRQGEPWRKITVEAEETPNKHFNVAKLKLRFRNCQSSLVWLEQRYLVVAKDKKYTRKYKKYYNGLEMWAMKV